MRPINFLFTTLFIILINCRSNESATQIIKIAVPKNVTYSLFWIAKEKHFFEKQNLNIEIFSDGEAFSLYQNGNIDLICSSLTEPILLNSEGIGTQIIYRFTYTSGNDVIISKPKYKKLEDLKGKTISFDGVNSSSHIFMEEILAKNGVKEGDYKTKNVSLHNMIPELQAESIQAGHTNIRYLDKIKPTEYNILARSSDLPDLVTEVLSGKTKFLLNHKNEIRRLIDSLLLAREYYNSNPEESKEIISKAFVKDKDLVSKEIDSLRFLSREENLQSLGNTKQQMDDPLHVQSNSFNINKGKKGALFLAAETIIQFLRTRGQLYKNPDLNQLIVNEYLKESKSP